MSTCRECGADTPAVELQGQRFELEVCPVCEPAVAAREDERDRVPTLEAALSRAGATPRLRGWSFASYLADAPPEAGGALAAARRWLAGYDAGTRQNLWLSGPVGTGKSGLAWSIVRALVEETVDRHFQTPPDARPAAVPARALFVVWRDLLADLKASFRSQESGQGDPSALLDHAHTVAVLALDDLGAERPTPYALEELATIVERRWQANRPIIVTSNFGSRDLAARLGERDPIIGERIVSRLVDGGIGFRFTGESRRRIAPSS